MRTSERVREVLTLATLVALCVPIRVCAQSDGGVVLDAPRVVKLTNGHYDFNPPAFNAVDAELKRLQQVERVHKGEPAWSVPVLVGLAVGVIAGTVGTLAGVFLWERLAVTASKPSP